MKKTMAEDVLAFMIAFDQPPTAPSARLNFRDIELGRQLIAEEVTELWEAQDELDDKQTVDTLAHFAKEACDLIYVLLWTLNKLGVPAQECWDEVQRSNMSKLNPDGSVSKYEDGPKKGKVKKPATYSPADMEPIIKRVFPDLGSV